MAYLAFVEPHGYVYLDQPLPALPLRKKQEFTRPPPSSPCGKEYTVDSVVWEFHAYLKDKWVVRYLVRWLKWEDEFNTIEPEYRMRKTFALWQFKNPNQKIGMGYGFSHRAIRSSADQIPPEEVEIHELSGAHYHALQNELKISIRAKHYTKYIGFHG
jgi:hypothetical protein